MTYEPLALRYRPRLFTDMVGQEHVTGGLRAAIEGGRVAHAYLFSGPRGTGKTTTARILARALNCVKGPTPDPCGECDACQAIRDGASLDVLELDAASQRKVEDTEEWVSTVHLVPVGRYKVYIVDEVHMFSKSSFNLLLKTFEEPPEHVVFVLATTEPEKVPATVRGRCQRFDFRLVPHEVLVNRYRYVCEREGVEPEPGALELIARQAAGSVRDGLTLLEQALSDDGTRVERARVHALTGAVDRGLVVDAVDLMITGDVAGVFPLVARVLGAGADLRRFTEDLVAHLRGVMLAGAGADPRRLLDAIDDHAALEMSRQAQSMGAEGAASRLTILADIAREVDNELLGRVILEGALLRCSTRTADDLATRVAALERMLQQTPLPAETPHAPEREPQPPPEKEDPSAPEPSPAERPHPPETPETPPPAPEARLPSELTQGWRDVALSVGPVARALLEGSHPLGLDGATLRVGVDEEFRLKRLADRAVEIEAAARRVFGPATTLRFEVTSTGPPGDPVAEAAADFADLADAEPVNTMNIVEMVKQGFAAEVIEEYRAE